MIIVQFTSRQNKICVLVLPSGGIVKLMRGRRVVMRVPLNGPVIRGPASHAVVPTGTYPGLHAHAQAPAVQLAVAFAGAVHGEQPVPHDATDVLSRQFVPQTWNPGLQVIEQPVARHVAVPLAAGVGHGVHAV
jgi:hypothetical protein